MSKIIDVSVPLTDTSNLEEIRYTTGPRAYYKPGDLYVKISMICSYSSAGKDRMTSRLDAPVHAGTHVDAPLHRIENGACLDDIPLQTFVGKMRVIDLSSKSKGLAIRAADLEDGAAGIGEIERLLIKTGWFKNLGNPAYYDSASPHLTLDSVRWIIAKGVKMLATDFMPDPPKDLGLPLQKKLLESGICILANLVNLDQISKKEVDIIALPIKIIGAEGAMCRAIVIEDSQV
ncbi:MAG: cyclase family protein [Nitrososphaerales archaeon]